MTQHETLLELTYLWLHRIECVNTKSVEAWHKWRRGKMTDYDFDLALRDATIRLRGCVERLEVLAAALSEKSKSDEAGRESVDRVDAS